MPVTSRSQMRFFQMLKHNLKRRQETGMSEEKVSEFIDETKDYKKLPERKGKFNKLSKYIK